MPTGITTRKKILFIALVLLLGIGRTAAAQTVGVYDERAAHNVVWDGKLQRQVEFFCDTLMGGRATGTRGGTEAAFALARKFGAIGLLPLGEGYGHSFYAKDSTVVGHNVIGMLPGSLKRPVETYIIVAAHYDHIGTLAGKLYPGADSNVSGTVSLISLAEMLSSMKTLGRAYGSNIIFAALDGSQLSMAGAYGLWRDIEAGRLTNPLTGRQITSDKVLLMVNIDQVGTSLSPLKSGREDFLIMLGTPSLPKGGCRDLLSTCNRFYDINLELDDTYYGSESFTSLFYTLSDQRPFVENKIPAVMFTSGITMNTNKTWDLPSTLNYPILRKRIYLIYHWIDRMTVYLSY
ncbi:MAG: M28 family peptidase [Bacteroidales bacterium]|nr:M28 family peptidase [Bacteroidales bacterium]